MFSWLHTQIWSCTCWTRVPLSLLTAWQQPLKTCKNLEWVTEGRMSRRPYDLHSLHRYHLGHWSGKALPPPPLCHPDRDHQISPKTVSCAPRASISDVTGYSGCKGLSSLEHVKIDWNAWTEACTVQWLPNGKSPAVEPSPILPPTFFPSHQEKNVFPPDIGMPNP